MKIKNKINVILTSLILSVTSAFMFSSCGDSLLDTIGDNEEVIQGNKVATIDQAAGMLRSAKQ